MAKNCSEFFGKPQYLPIMPCADNMLNHGTSPMAMTTPPLQQPKFLSQLKAKAYPSDNSKDINKRKKKKALMIEKLTMKNTHVVGTR